MVPPWVVLRTVTIFKELFRSFEMDARSMPTSVGLNCTGEENGGRGGQKFWGTMSESCCTSLRSSNEGS
jgi:hypothetical protein